MNGIQLEAKVETTLVEVSATMTAIGAAGLVAVPSLPAEYQAPVTAALGVIAGIGTTMLAVWHKFVNVATATPAPTTPA
jgi:hypothetical protein